jgi:hypothetical protein
LSHFAQLCDSADFDPFDYKDVASDGGGGWAAQLVPHNSRIPLQLATMTSFQPGGKSYDTTGVLPDGESKPAAGLG